ncbi:MAG: hypothetical protein OEZ20_08175, partial [candidate division WOR-3 bacterium]|nr:hypothetical protein [candidate division WOR-3 bacterium]
FSKKGLNSIKRFLLTAGFLALLIITVANGEIVKHRNRCLVRIFHIVITMMKELIYEHGNYTQNG